MPLPLLAWGIATVAGYVTKKVCDTVVESKKISGSSNPPTKTQTQQQEVLKSITDRLDNLDKNIGDKIKEQLDGKQMNPREKKEKLEEIKKMSNEEKAELLKDLKDENIAEQKAINKVLQEQLNKQEKSSIQLAEELRKAKEGSDPAQVAKIATMMKDNDKNQQATRLALKKNEEEAKNQVKMIEEYFKSVEQDKPWYLDMNFKSPWLWGILVFSLVSTYFMYKGFMWIWGKVKTAIWGDN